MLLGLRKLAAHANTVMTTTLIVTSLVSSLEKKTNMAHVVGWPHCHVSTHSFSQVWNYVIRALLKGRPRASQSPRVITLSHSRLFPPSQQQCKAARIILSCGVSKASSNELWFQEQEMVSCPNAWNNAFGKEQYIYKSYSTLKWKTELKQNFISCITIISLINLS